MSRKDSSRAALQPALLALVAASILALVAAFEIRTRSPARERRDHERPLAVVPRLTTRATANQPVAVPTDETLRAWALDSPRAHWAWLRENSARLSPPDEPSLVAVFFRHLAARDPDAVLAFANESLARADRAAIASAAINALLENNWPALAREQVERWACDGLASAIGAAPLQAVAWQLARESDRAAADWLLALPASPERDAALAGTAANWAEHDPGAAMTFALAVANPDARAATLEHAFRVWADHGAGTAADWLLEHESRPEADRLVAAWLNASPVANDNPRTALRWAALIRDDATRRHSYATVLEKWRDRDALAAQQFLAAGESR